MAIIVVQTHLWSKGMDWMGQISVFAFYTLSGYLMTRVLNTRYGFSWGGTAAFFANRILRLWPAYLVLMALVLFALQFLPLQTFNQVIRIPASAIEIVTNALLLGQVTFDFLQWIPLAKPLVTSWSLSIEMCCYLLLAFYFARSPARLFVFFILGILAMAMSTGWCIASENPAAYGRYCFQNRYGVIQAGFIPFAMGGIYFFRQELLRDWISRHSRILWACLCGVTALMFAGPLLSATIAPFLGIPLTWLLLAAAQENRLGAVSNFFGRASYYLFISHMPIAAILVTGLHFKPYGRVLFFVTVLVSLGLSVGLVPMEWRIERLRGRISKTLESSHPH